MCLLYGWAPGPQIPLNIFPHGLLWMLLLSHLLSFGEVSGSGVHGWPLPLCSPRLLSGTGCFLLAISCFPILQKTPKQDQNQNKQKQMHKYNIQTKENHTKKAGEGL